MRQPANLMTIPMVVATILLLTTGCVRDYLKPENRTDQMRRLAVCMAEEAHKRDPDFIMVVQNAPALANEIEGGERNGVLSDFQAEMDAYSAEALFFDGDTVPNIDSLKIAHLKAVPAHAAILVMDLMGDDNLQPAIDLANDQERFITSPRSQTNRDYTEIPPVTPGENNRDILRITDARNFLYLINSSNYQTTDELLDSIAATSFDVVFLDLFTQEGETFSPAQLDRIRAKANGGSRLILSYINVGAMEDWRYYCSDSCAKHLPQLVACEYDSFPGEYWVNYWAPKWHKIMYQDKDSYLQQILDAGFDGIVMDNMEAYVNQCDSI